jgi:predicted nucleic acid-binding Zn ribbon protein
LRPSPAPRTEIPAAPALSRSKHLKGGAAGQPQAVGDLLARYLTRSGLAPKVEAASALAEWADRVGPQIAAVTQPLRVNEGTLFVAVQTSAWMMELNLMKGELMRHLNAGKGRGKLSQLVFVMGDGSPQPNGAEFRGKTEHRP